MDAHVPQNVTSPGWVFVVGLLIAGTAAKQGLARVASSPIAVLPKRPSLVTTMVAGALIKDAVGRIGSSALGVPEGSDPRA
jgi:hypothetical protein